MMGHEDAIEELIAAVGTTGLLRNPRRVEQPAGWRGAIIEGEADVAGQEVTLLLVLDGFFPLSLPSILLRPWDALGFIPHVSPWGFVCFLDHEGLVLDQSQPGQIVIDALERAIDVLTAGVTGQNRSDFTDEFEIYWSYLPGATTAFSVLDPIDEVAEIVLAFKKGELRWVARAERHIAAFGNGVDVGGAYTLQNGLYLPLEPGTVLIPPLPDGPFWTAAEVRQALLPGLSDANRARLRKLSKGRPRTKEYVIVKLPQPSGGATLFGIRYEGNGEEHPLWESGTAERLAPLQISRLDRDYLVGRGGGTAPLSGKRVLLVGCGAVGGYLAFELARAGVLNLTLVDNDKLLPENTFRHVLGRRAWGKEKATALKEELEGQLPYVRVTAVVNTIEATLAEGAVDLAVYDLVVCALGNPTVELALNERLRTLPDGPAALFTWLEPLGIGGHALLTGNGPEGGCFACLYTPPDDDGDEELTNRAAFAAPRQSFGRALSGCGSLHTPYGSIDAVRTANLATRLAVDMLSGKETGNPLLSWKGDAGEFLAAGFRLSTRYGGSEEEFQRHRYTYRVPHCRLCGGRDEVLP